MADDLWSGLGYTAPQADQPSSDDLKAIVASKAAQYGIPADLADRLVAQESKYNPKATSQKGARGLTQLMPDTAKQYGVADVEDPSQNVDGGLHYLADLHAKYGDWSKALAAYNAGPDAVDKAGGIPAIPETQNYVKTVLGQSESSAGTPKGDLWGSLGYNPNAGAPSRPEFDAEHPKMIKYAELNPADQKAYQTLYEGGVLDPNAPQGSEHLPFFNTDPKQVPAGAYYVQNGKVLRAPGGPKESSIAAGLGQGVGDIGASISHMLPGSDDSQVKQSLLANQMLYGAKYGGDLASGAGRFTGQLLGSAPLLAGGEAAATPLIARMSPAVATFLAGRAGAVAGAPLASKLLRVGSLAAAGGNAGAGAAALTSSANPEQSVPSQIAGGYAGGALVGPLAPAFGAAGRGIGRLARSLTEPLTGPGQEQIVSRLLGDVSGGSSVRPDLTPIVPGSEPTLAESAGNAGISALERNVRTNPRVAQRFTERQAQNSLARTNLFNSVAGDENSLARLEDAREAATAGARETALQGQSQPANVAPVIGVIDGILQGAEGKRREVVKALNDVRSNLFDAQGNPETSAEILYGVRKDIGDLLSGKASTERSGAQVATAQLKQVQGALDNAIQEVAPGFKEYLKTYSDMSKPIDEQRFLQSLKIADVNGNITLSRVNSALDKIDTMKKKPGANEAKSISDSTYQVLQALQDDLKRQGNIDLGKARGSDTAQNLVTEGIAKAAGVPSDLAAAFGIHPKAAVVMGLGKLLYGSKNPQVLERLATRLLEPGAAPVPAPVLQSRITGPIRKAAKVVTPPAAAIGGLAANRLLSSQ